MDVRKISYTAMFTALAVILHYFESLIPVPIPIPGFKLGLANIVGVFALFYLGWQYYIACTVSRVLIVALISTGFGTAFFLASGGAVLAVIFSIIFKYCLRASPYGVSTGGAFFHVVGQILMYILITKTPYLMSYLPVLAALSMTAGFILGFFCDLILKRLPPCPVWPSRKKKVH